MDKLKELLGEELFNQVKEKLGDTKIMVDDGNFIPKHRFDEVNDERQNLKDMLKERDDQLKEIKKQAKDSDELTTKINDLQEQNKKTVEEYEEKLNSQRFNFAVERELSKAEAKSVKAVKALLDLEKVKMDGDTLIGLEEQVKQVKESEPYLFGADLKGRTPHPDKTPPPPQDNPWKKESYNLTKQGQILKDDPELARRLKQQAGVE